MSRTNDAGVLVNADYKPNISPKSSGTIHPAHLYWSAHPVSSFLARDDPIATERTHSAFDVGDAFSAMVLTELGTMCSRNLPVATSAPLDVVEKV